MSKLTSKNVLAATVAGLAVAGGGAAIAASQTDSPASSFLDSVAKHLGISSDKLEDATQAAAVDQVNQALEDGQITKEQADELKSRIESGEFPLFLGPGFFGLRHQARARRLRAALLLRRQARGGGRVPRADGGRAARAARGRQVARRRRQGQGQVRRRPRAGHPRRRQVGARRGGQVRAADAGAGGRGLPAPPGLHRRHRERRLSGPRHGRFFGGPGFGPPPGFAPPDGGDDDGGSGGGSGGDAPQWDTAA